MKGSNIPQADSVETIFSFVEKVNDGHNDINKMAKSMAWDNRQSSYYREAGEILGIIGKYNNLYVVTNLGKQYLETSSAQKKIFICNLLLQNTIINEIIMKLIANPILVISIEDITKIIMRESRLSSNTAQRRSQTSIAWLKWIEDNFGYVKTIDNKRVLLNKDYGIDTLTKGE